MSNNDVALALNHVENGNRVTDIYIAKYWRIIDDIQSKVVVISMDIGKASKIKVEIPRRM